MASESLTVQNNPKLLSQIKETLKALFGVSISLEGIDFTKDDEENENIAEKSCTIGECGISRSKAKQNGQKSAADATQGSPVKRDVSTMDSMPITLRFHTEGPPENIEKAKNFAHGHLIPSPDYTTNTHQLGNHQEFEMVFESSHEIQKSSAALLTFNPDCDKLTISGDEKSVAVATSQMVMILDKHRDQTNALVVTRTDNDIQSDPRPDNLTSSSNLVIQNVKNLSNGSLAQTTDVSPLLERNVIKNTHKTNKNNCDTLLQSRYHISDLYSLTESHGSVETDCAQVSNPHIYRDIHTEYEHRKDKGTLKKLSSSSLSSSSSDDENAAEEDILTDLRYSKQVEQALKLGYTETHVKQALATLGPDCELNDLLSELIKIGAAETRTSPTQNFIQGNEREQQEWLEGGSEEYFYNLSSSGANSASDSVTQKYIDVNDSSNLRHIIIDGSNVAMSHGKKIFSCKGIKIAVDWFRDRGHKNITVFVPMWRKETSRPDAPISDQAILSELEIEGIVVFTPSRRVKGRKVVCYDDRYVLKTASETNGIVVSNDVYRDLVSESEDFRQVVDQRLLMYSFVNDRFMPPEDPLGRLGPTLDNFLRKTPAEPSPKPQDCPYGKKCTYGNKCRFYHPERGFAPQKLITETLKEQADFKLQERASKRLEIAEKGKRPKQKLARTKSLVPGESFPVSATSPTNENDSLGGKEKPKLHHSKSLVYPVKTPDYLNESRKKLEEAEMSAALEKMSVQQKETSLKKTLSPESSNFGSLSKHSDASQMQAPNQRTSPLPHEDSLTLTGLPSDPLKMATSKSPRASPTHLTVPKSESREGYLSGHLLLAKKLSDESKENNFFSEHTSSPSSTRTSSPVVPSKTTEQRQSLMETLLGEPQGNSTQDSGSGMQQHLLSPQFLQQYQAFDPRTDHGLDNLPNLSVFEQNSLQYPSDLEHMAANRRLSADSAIVLSPNTLPHSSDSSHYTGFTSPGCNSLADQPSSPFQSSIDFPPPSNIQQYKDNLLSKAESTHQPHEHLSLRRAFSSTGNVKTEEESLPSGRRASGFAASQLRGDHVMLKAQQSVPAHRRTSAYQVVHPHGLTRQNSSSDPQLHNIRGAGDMSDVFLPAFGTSKVQDPQSFFRQQHLDEMRQFVQTPQQLQHSQQFDTQHYHRFQQLQQQQPQLQFLQQQQQQQQQQFQQAQDTSLMSPQFMSKPPLVGWGQQNLIARSLLVQSPPQHSHMPVPGSGHFVPCTGDPAYISAGPHMSSPPQTSPFPQQHVPFPAHYGLASSPAMVSSSPRQSFPPQPTYPQRQTILQNSQMYGLPEQGQRMQPSTLYQAAQSSSSQFHPSVSRIASDIAAISPSDPRYNPSATRILPEEAPIVPSDPRYNLYYNLSGVFPEQDVRKVMNMYPNELNPDRICNLITNYRETK